MTRKFEEFAAKLLLDLELADGVVAVATEALEAGEDSPTLRSLAAMSNPRREEVIALVDTALEEMRMPRLTPESATRYLARRKARDILNNKITPYDGAKAIWNMVTRLRPQRLPEFDPFVYAASEWEERIRDRPFFDRSIVESAKELLRHEDPRPPRGKKE